MHGQQELSETDALEQLLGTRFPWVPTEELHRASEFLVKQMANLGIDDSPEITPRLMEEAEEVGHALAAGFIQVAPAWSAPASSSHAKLLQHFAGDILQRVGIGRAVKGRIGRVVGR